MFEFKQHQKQISKRFYVIKRQRKLKQDCFIFFMCSHFLTYFFLIPQRASSFRHPIHGNDKNKNSEIWVKSNLISWCHPALECHTSERPPFSSSQAKTWWKNALGNQPQINVTKCRLFLSVTSHGPCLERGKIPYFYLYFLPTRVETQRWGRNDIFFSFSTISFSHWGIEKGLVKMWCHSILHGAFARSYFYSTCSRSGEGSFFSVLHFLTSGSCFFLFSSGNNVFLRVCGKNC